MCINLILVVVIVIKIKIKAYGIFGDYIGSDFFILEFNSNVNLIFVKQIIGKKFSFSVNDLKLLESSVFSTENVVLPDSHIINDNDIVYLLPPVSGG